MSRQSEGEGGANGVMTQATELETMWAGDFGSAYNERNRTLDERRGAFWTNLVETHGIRSVLEIGCGQGGNLKPIAAVLDPHDVWGVDINEDAVAIARTHAPGINVVASRARRLPFRDGLVDLAFTCCVLIHQPETTLPIVMAEIVRCSGRYVLWAEYHASTTEEVSYHGKSGALYRRDYASIYRELFPELRPIQDGYLGPDDGFDRVTWALLEKP